MTIAVGDKIPSVTLTHMTDDGPAEITTDELLANKKVVLFALPGAFTPTCSASHLPGFVANAAKLKDKGAADIVCLSVNDAFVMHAWGEAQHAAGKVHMVADGNGDLTKALDLVLDLTPRGMGVRSQRYAMIVDNGTVTAINVEDGGAFDVSSAETMLELL